MQDREIIQPMETAEMIRPTQGTPMDIRRYRPEMIRQLRRLWQ